MVVERFGLKGDDVAETEAALCDHEQLLVGDGAAVVGEIRRRRDLHDGTG